MQTVYVAISFTDDGECLNELRGLMTAVKSHTDYLMTGYKDVDPPVKGKVFVSWSVVSHEPVPVDEGELNG